MENPTANSNFYLKQHGIGQQAMMFPYIYINIVPSLP